MVKDSNGNYPIPEEEAVTVATNVANQNNDRAHRKKISLEEMVNVYSDWAATYEQDLCPGRYNGPEIAAEVMAKHIPLEQRAEVKIIDVAAGTGRVGEELVKKGFKNMDALEPSPGMLKVLTEKNVYKQTFMHPVGYGAILEIPANTYDALVIAGGMGEGHIPLCAVREMIRMIKPGALFFIIMREEYLKTVDDYKELEDFMTNELVTLRYWTLVDRMVVPNYSFENNGAVFVFKKV